MGQRQGALLVGLLAVAAVGCRAFDERWTEVLVTADPEVSAVASNFTYCLWDDSGVVRSEEGLIVRSGCDDRGTEPIEGTAAIPGAVVVRNPSGSDAVIHTFFQLEVSSGGLDCFAGCPPGDTPTPPEFGRCITSMRGQNIVLDPGYEPTRYALHFSAVRGTLAPSEPDAGSPPCP